jgi:hypothetical protein
MQRPMCQATNGLPDLFKDAKIGFAFFCRIANVQVKQKIYLNQFSSWTSFSLQKSVPEKRCAVAKFFLQKNATLPICKLLFFCSVNFKRFWHKNRLVDVLVRVSFILIRNYFLNSAQRISKSGKKCKVIAKKCFVSRSKTSMNLYFLVVQTYFLYLYFCIICFCSAKRILIRMPARYQLPGRPEKCGGCTYVYIRNQCNLIVWAV